MIVDNGRILDVMAMLIEPSVKGTWNMYFGAAVQNCIYTDSTSVARTQGYTACHIDLIVAAIGDVTDVEICLKRRGAKSFWHLRNKSTRFNVHKRCLSILQLQHEIIHF